MAEKVFYMDNEAVHIPIVEEHKKKPKISKNTLKKVGIGIAIGTGVGLLIGGVMTIVFTKKNGVDMFSIEKERTKCKE